MSDERERPKQDRLYETRAPTPFVFDAAVVGVFDDMIDRSVPLFAPMSALFAELAAGAVEHATHRDRGDETPLIVDMGCSSGTRTQRLAERAPAARVLGIDLSPDMIATAIARNPSPDRVRYHCADAVDPIPRCDVIVCSYTLQFVPECRRRPLLQQWRAALGARGVLLLAEKLRSDDRETQRVWIEAHEDFKRQQGYSEREIAAKRKALEGVLIPWTEEQWRDALAEAGFDSVAALTRWLAFASFAAR